MQDGEPREGHGWVPPGALVALWAQAAAPGLQGGSQDGGSTQEVKHGC